MKTIHPTALACFAVVMISHPASGQDEKITSNEKDGRLEVAHEGATIFGWQVKPLENPKGGTKFAASAFLHPFRTPSGFEATTIQPSDHLHHLGLWWPWKFIEVDGASYNSWEIQQGQGAHVSTSVKPLPDFPNGLAWEFRNQTEIRKPDTAPQAVIEEIATVSLQNTDDSRIIDIQLRQKSLDQPVTIAAYRYSGFTWRGPDSWNKDNSTMTTSEGLGRDEANGKHARWVMISGTAPKGHATVLLMSAAAELAGTPEKLRVWDSNAHHGAPFINFNPVMGKALPLDDANPAVSNRRYRVIAADRLIDTATAEAEWREWMEK